MGISAFRARVVSAQNGRRRQRRRGALTAPPQSQQSRQRRRDERAAARDGVGGHAGEFRCVRVWLRLRLRPTAAELILFLFRCPAASPSAARASASAHPPSLLLGRYLEETLSQRIPHRGPPLRINCHGRTRVVARPTLRAFFVASLFPLSIDQNPSFPPPGLARSRARETRRAIQ